MKRFSATLVAAVLAAGIAARADDASPTNAVATNTVASTNAAVAPASAATGLTLAEPTSDHGGFGLGVILGEPTGLSAKYWFSDVTAADLGVAWSFEDSGSFHLHGDFLWHFFDVLKVTKGELPLYLGVGGRLQVPDHGDTRAGVRIPVGIAYEFADVPIEVFAEVAPIVDVTPSTQLRWNGGVGIRYFFR